MAPNSSVRVREIKRGVFLCLDNYTVIFIGRSPPFYSCYVESLTETRATRTTTSFSPLLHIAISGAEYINTKIKNNYDLSFTNTRVCAEKLLELHE